MNKLNIDLDEHRKFAELANSWWDSEGEFKTLHDLNPARTTYISDRAELKGARVLDVGCGGGILSESLAAAGAEVTAIDIVEKSLDIGRLHLLESGVSVDYQCITAEELATTMAGSFDVVTCLEMLEHVPAPNSVVAACSQLLKPGGNLFLSTINRTPQAFAIAIVGAEHIMRLLPQGTHEYRKFIRPAELSSWLRSSGMTVEDIRGLHYNPISRSVRLGGNVDVNFLVHARKSEPLE
jgi:2-polyprenyl-6-hydroxyphenyl methylase/3-demethylubiquinone-9 3-methyltransferase